MLWTSYASLWRGRALFVIHDERQCEGAPWRAVLRSTLETPLAHAVLVVSRNEDRALDGVGLPPVGVDELIAAVLPSPLTPRLEARVRRAAVASVGRPGRFARLLWPDWIGERPRRHYGRRAAEHAASYGAGEHERPSAVGEETTEIRAWASPGELPGLRNRVTAARADLAAGRHASALRSLRQAACAFARRDAWADAAAAGLAAAGALLARGRIREVLAALEDVRGYADRCGDAGTVLDVAILSGEARVDGMRFGEAETILAAAVTAANHARDGGRAAAAGVALARCLFWRGQYLDAARALDPCDDEAPHDVRVRRARLLARVHVGLGDLTTALAIVATLKRDAGASDERLRSAIACTTAFVYLRVGDLDAAAREVQDGLAAARAAHDPLRAIRLRLLFIEIERRRNRVTTALRHLERLKRLNDRLPAILRARRDLLMQLSLRDGKTAAPAGPLALFMPVDASAGRSDPAIDDVIVILRACQTAEDEAVVLKDVCAHLRGQLRAIAAAFVVQAGRGCEVFVFDGGRVDLEMAERAMTAGVVIRPHRYEERIGGAAPVLYGGTAAGALCARWSIGSGFDTDRACSVLAMAATAAAPVLAAALAHRARTALPEGAAVAPLLGVTPAMSELRHAAQRAGAAPFGVLIVGESGSGKELVARAIHRSSPRRDGPFCALNCAALPDDLVESELFGHARGAFTGAAADRAGVFEEAHGGTLFLDEIGELSPRAQAKILRVIQEGELRRVGENLPRRVDVRLIAATNRDLAREVEAARFRLDLLYRLDVVRIAVPPLRERADDIAILAAHFWTEATARMNSRATLSPATIAALTRYEWPGNVRELQNVLAALAVRCPRRGLVPATALPAQFGVVRNRDENWRLDDARRTFEERFVRAALVRTGGHRTRAAAELGVSRQGLTKLLARLGISDSA
jgi:DNA-binding NtrC family response regulator/tetratricopeptide (TPR) repeat protein